jgi:hypothetical protein
MIKYEGIEFDSVKELMQYQNEQKNSGKKPNLFPDAEAKKLECQIGNCDHEHLTYSHGIAIAWLFPIPREWHEWVCKDCGKSFKNDPRPIKRNICCQVSNCEEDAVYIVPSIKNGIECQIRFCENHFNSLRGKTMSFSEKSQSVLIS